MFTKKKKKREKEKSSKQYMVRVLGKQAEVGGIGAVLSAVRCVL